MNPTHSSAEFRTRLTSLVTTYERHRGLFRSESYKEAQARCDFIDPFLTALGWDVYNTAQQFQRREVTFEQRLFDTRGQPDYTIFQNERPYLVVEAKRPSVNLRPIDSSAAFQTHAYAYEHRAVAGVLTNFESLHIYHSAFSPEEDGDALLLSLSWQRYLDSADVIWKLISKESATEHRLERHVVTTVNDVERTDLWFARLAADSAARSDEAFVTVRLPSQYKQRFEEHRIALGAKSAPKALQRILDCNPDDLAKFVLAHEHLKKGTPR